MARKKLLTEGEIRQFMKLANLRPIGEDRLSEMGGGYMAGARDDDEEDEGAEGDEGEDVEGMLGLEEPEGVDEPAEAGPELDAGDGMMGGMYADEREEILTDVVMAVAQKLGIEDRVDVEEVEGDADMEDMGDMGDMGDMEDDEPAEDPADELDPDDVVAEVVNRVASRLQRENRKEQLAEQLAAQIMKRLTK